MNIDMYRYIQFHVQRTDAISCAVLCRVLIISQFYSLTSSFFGALHLFTEKLKWMIWRYLYVLETLISIEYGLTFSGHGTVHRKWVLEKGTNYIIKLFMYAFTKINNNKKRHQ